MRKLNIIKIGKLLDNETILYILKKPILDLINHFMQRLKKGDIKSLEISGTFSALAYEFEDLRKEVEPRLKTSSIKSGSNIAKTITDLKRIAQELRTLFQLPVKDLIRELEAGTASDKDLYNSFDYWADTAQTWARRTEW